MRLGIVSDIHGNLAGLDLALAQMGPVDQLLCAGDAFHEYRFSNGVVARLKEIGARYVLGNHEAVLLSGNGIRAQQAPWVDQELLAWTREQPFSLREEVGGKTLLLFHSTPWAPYLDYLYPNSPDFPRLAELDADFVIYGHTHHPLAQRVGRTLIINPGSTGDPRNGLQLSYAVLDTAAETVTFGAFPDPRRRTLMATEPPDRPDGPPRDNTGEQETNPFRFQVGTAAVRY